MAKLFKNSKQTLALVMAFAILAVSLFAGGIVAGAEGTATPLCNGTGALMFWDGTYDSTLADNGETGATEDDPIIVDNAAELNYMANYLKGGSVKDKYYKMADGIKYMFLQPQDVAVTDSDGNGVYDILELTDGNATKKYFEETITPLNWSSKDQETWFANNFDGNGVTFVGMYSVSRSAGLFPTADGGASFKNFAVINSYIHGNGGQSRTGTIVGGTCGGGFGAKRAGILTFDSVMIVNNYLRAQLTATAAGILWGGCNDQEVGHVNNAVVYGNVGLFGKPGVADAALTPLTLFNGWREAESINTVTNSVILGTTPYPSSYYKKTAGVECFENVITDANVAPWDSKADYKDTDMLSVEGLSAYEIMSEYKSMFSAFHGEIVEVKDTKTHSFKCADCGFAFYGGEAKHTWELQENESYVCSDCGEQCLHTNVSFDANFAGDCVTEPGTLTVCNDCGWTKHISSGPAPGHTLEWVDEIIADCDSTGREGYWHCTVCDGNFVGEKADVLGAAMDTSIENPDEALFVPIAPHAAFDRTGEDETVKIVVVGNDGHYWECYTCEGKLLAVESDDIAAEDKVKKHKYDGGVCVDCGWECPEHDYQPTGNVLVPGTCTVDREEELKCTNCGDVKAKVITAGHNIVKVEEVKATDNLEGTKAHYECTECKELYTDAEGKNNATMASLVIPKELPDEYKNVVVGGNNAENLNTDTSSKSPSTSDSFASVVALAALAGTAIVFARKVK